VQRPNTNLKLGLLSVYLVVLFAAMSAQAKESCSLPGVSKRLLRGPNAVAKGLLCPKLLRDSETTAAYIKAFPRKNYTIKAVKGADRYYLDPRDDVIKSVLRRGDIWETHIRAILKAHVQRGTSVVDAGAHIGTHTMLLSKLVGSRGRVYAFEPQKKIFRELLQNLKLNQSRSVIPLRFALGDKPQVIEMNSSASGNEGGTGIGRGGDKAELRTIDSFGFSNLSLLKIDVEGFEDHVLEGARETIARYRPVILLEIQGGNDLGKASLAVKKRIWSSVAKLIALGYQVQRVGVHDYLATYNAPSPHSVRVGFYRQIPAYSPQLASVVGIRRDATIRSSGKAGQLCFGPYEYLPAGSYVVKFYGRAEGKSSVKFDVASRRGKQVHARASVTLNRRPASHNFAILSFTLAKAADEVEYRIWVDQGAKVMLERIEVQWLAADR